MIGSAAFDDNEGTNLKKLQDALNEDMKSTSNKRVHSRSFSTKTIEFAQS